MADWRAIMLPAVFLAAGCSLDQTLLTLNQVCDIDFDGTEGCFVRFDAKLSSGVGAGVTAAHLGEKGGELHILINRIRASSDTWSLDVLAASTADGSTMTRTITYGSCGANCPAEPGDAQVELTDGFNWGAVVRDEPGTGISGNVPSDAVIVLSGENIDIVALRTPGHENRFTTGSF